MYHHVDDADCRQHFHLLVHNMDQGGLSTTVVSKRAQPRQGRAGLQQTSSGNEAVKGPVVGCGMCRSWPVPMFDP